MSTFYIASLKTQIIPKTSWWTNDEILPRVTWFKNLDVKRRKILLKYIFRDDSNEELRMPMKICVCPDFMTCEEKDTSDMDREDMLHLIYGCGFVVFFIVLISKYIKITSGRWFQTAKLFPHWPEVRFMEILIFWFRKNPDFKVDKLSLSIHYGYDHKRFIIVS